MLTPELGFVDIPTHGLHVGARVSFTVHAGRVALVDRQRGLGGAGGNTGTVPSKTLRETALAISGSRARKLVVVDLSLRREATVGDFLNHEQEVKSVANSGLLQMVKGSKIDVYDGVASFVETHFNGRAREIGRRRCADVGCTRPALAAFFMAKKKSRGGGI